MGSKLHLPPSQSRNGFQQSPILLFTISLFAFSLLFFPFSISSQAPSPTHSPNPSDELTPRPQTSLLASLDHFLTRKAPKNYLVRDSVVYEASEDEVREMDDEIRMRERERLHRDPFYPMDLPLRVYVYQMPKKFTYDLLALFWNTFKNPLNFTSTDTTHLLIQQHSVDYWLWADLTTPESERLVKSVVRVRRPEEADLFYIPFFTTISHFLLDKELCQTLYMEALKWVTDQPAWKRSQGRDHILPIHHPLSFKSVRKYMKNAIWLLPDIASRRNWYEGEVVMLEKDLILPYVPTVDFCDAKCLSESESKTILLYLWMEPNQISGRSTYVNLMEELGGSDGVVIEEVKNELDNKNEYQSAMRQSVFCLVLADETPSTRLFDAIISGCIPVIVNDDLELPFEGILDYRKVALFVSSAEALQPGWLLRLLRGFSLNDLREMQQYLPQYSRHFIYSSPAQPLGPEDLFWRMMAGKLMNVKLQTRRSQRAVKESASTGSKC